MLEKFINYLATLARLAIAKSYSSMETVVVSIVYNSESIKSEAKTVIDLCQSELKDISTVSEFMNLIRQNRLCGDEIPSSKRITIIDSYSQNDSSGNAYEIDLFNAGGGTNFIYKVEFPGETDVDCDKFNRETYKGKPGKISFRLNEIARLGGKVEFQRVESECLTQNLRTIDGDLPIILANALMFKYKYNLSDWKDIIKKLNEINPCSYRITQESEVYDYKLKRFLQDAAMGMTPEKPWYGFYDATGGQIVVTKDGDIVCYHVYELNKYLQYLLNWTQIEQPSTGEDENNPGHIRIDAETGKPKKPFLYGWLYKVDSDYFIKINLQVRFKEMPRK